MEVRQNEMSPVIAVCLVDDIVRSRTYSVFNRLFQRIFPPRTFLAGVTGPCEDQPEFGSGKELPSWRTIALALSLFHLSLWKNSSTLYLRCHV